MPDAHSGMEREYIRDHTSKTTRQPTIVVGAGPVGLLLAGDLGRSRPGSDRAEMSVGHGSEDQPGVDGARPERPGRRRRHKELAETEAEVARLEAAEVVIGPFIEAERAGEADDAVMDAELERVTTASGAGGMLLIPPREDGMDQDVLPEDYQAIMRVVAGVAEPVKAAEVSVALGKRTLPGQVEAVRAKLKRLAERG
ncbi:hypothetical protein [Streptomyces sp. NBC_01483]|uniref:hypothetical protein n=1 Tax=Streptomyces sp. NBC_01483 TaxID=2903883 RepID=UPI002E30EEC9|nr:hypothetical protein [Streptomyces sp. NBC_01483]